MKKFKSKKRNSLFKKVSITIILIVISFLVIFHYLYQFYINKIDNEDLVKFLINYNFNNDDNFLTSSNFLIKYALGENKISTLEVVEEVSDEPIIYIYNTHQSETYQKTNNMSYNITPNVLMASLILKEYLSDLNISSLVEESDINTLLSLNNWEYKNSYKASRILMENAKSDNTSLNYFLDIHRDSMEYDVTTTTINDTSYAKVLFVIGKDHDNYLENYAFATQVNNYLTLNYPTVSRGISLKTGALVNGIYNQDFNSNTILIEIGGKDNTILEVNNTIKILADALFNYLGEEYEE
jgi:stage II sporulation protein P